MSLSDSAPSTSWHRGYKTFFMLKSAEHEIRPANKILTIENSFLLNTTEHENLLKNIYKCQKYLSFLYL